MSSSLTPWYLLVTSAVQLRDVNADGRVCREIRNLGSVEPVYVDVKQSVIIERAKSCFTEMESLVLYL